VKRSLAPWSTLALLMVLLGACAPAAPAAPQAPAAAKPARAAGAAPQNPAAPPSDYFVGKTITALVNFSAGGPTDIFARMVVAHLDKHIPGRPKIIVDNKAGAGGVIGANQLFSGARKDGLTLGIFSSPFGNQVMEGEGVQYDAARFLWLGGVNETSVTYIASNVGVRAARDLPRATGDIVVGGLSPDNSKDLEMRSFFNTLGLKYKYVTGYPGAADVTLAVRRGEVNFGHDSLTSWVSTIVPMIREGTVVAMAQRGNPQAGLIVRDPRVGDIPTYGEVAVELKGDAVRQTVDYRALTIIAQLGAMLRAMVYPPGVDAGLVEVMRQAMADTFADPEFQAAAEKQLGFQFEFVPGAEAQELAQAILNQANEDREALEYLRRLSRDSN
jgi:tripartite-type tricarboxylate transporter receptor subunit TctC